MISTLNTEFQKIDVWLQANKLTLYTSKNHTLYGLYGHRVGIKCKSEKIVIKNNKIVAVKSTVF